MSEYQFIHFLAMDRPLDDKQLEFMRRQSSRAEITGWEFTNEYHFGDFHGNAMEMLRRGYDVHLHYANYGIRKLMFRLPVAAQSLADLRDALGPDHGPQQAQAIAEKLRRENPTLKLLTSALRKHGLLGKRP